MSTTGSNRILKNTIFLYFRQILIMLINLYAMRVILDKLGAEDYGIYTVVGGVVVFFAFLNNALTSATQRFLNYELGKKTESKAKQVFNASFLLHSTIAILVIILSETGGLWFVNSRLNIPAGRHSAALWCYQFSILALVINIIRVPFHATIIAYERMDFFAFLSILEAILKLVIVFAITITNFDKLIVYSFLTSMVIFIITFIYWIYCKNKYEITRFNKVQEKCIFKDLVSFSAWLLAGGIADVCKSQGITMILNMFCGVIVNAAMGIAQQINSVIGQFVTNFQVAYTPQIVKSFAAGENNKFQTLIVQSMKVSFMLITFIGIPFAVNAELVVTLWLKEIPEFTLLFIRLMLIDSVVYAFIGPLSTAITAVGDIKGYQIGVSVFNFLNLPVSYIALKIGAPAYSILVVRIAISFIALIWRFFYLRQKIGLNPWLLILDPFIKSVFVLIISLAGTYLIFVIINNSVIRFFDSCITSVFLNLCLFYLILLNKTERELMITLLKKRLLKK